MGQFVNGTCALAGIDSRMRSYTSDLQLVNSDSLARGLDRAIQPLSRLEDEHSLGFQCQTLGNLPR